MALLYVLLHSIGERKKKPEEAVHIYADGVVTDETGILI